ISILFLLFHCHPLSIAVHSCAQLCIQNISGISFFCSLTPSVPEVSTIIDSCGLRVLRNRNHIRAQAGNNY
ncbi:hypothetical protein DFH08DRAFT_847569, partial [Mycena albidolilacea]